VEKTIIQINIPEGLRVNCLTQLLSDRAMTWWETIQLRCAFETLTWSDFKSEFECKHPKENIYIFREREMMMNAVFAADAEIGSDAVFAADSGLGS